MTVPLASKEIVRAPAGGDLARVIISSALAEPHLGSTSAGA